MLPELAPWAWGLVAAIFLLAGGVKGVVGMGLPTVAMGLLGLVLPPAQAAALLIIPSLLTNLWQMADGPALRALLRRFALLQVLLFAGTLLGVRLLTTPGARWPQVLLGTVLLVYGLIGLLLRRRLQLPERAERWSAPLIGGLTGVLTGATGVAVVPLVPYASALRLEKEALIQFLGLSFTVSTAGLALGLGSAGAYPPSLALASLGLLIPTLIGLWGGQRLRARLPAEGFCRGFFIAMALLGAAILLRAVS
jgi:uncharacterized membrane protein YfcA